jgi:hypothetical protein
MPRGDKSKYTDKQDRKAEHIEQSYEKRGVPEKEAERRAWATVNTDDGGGKRADRVGANRLAIPPHTKAVSSAAPRRRHDRLRVDLRRQKRPPLRASETPLMRPTKTEDKYE